MRPRKVREANANPARVEMITMPIVTVEAMMIELMMPVMKWAFSASNTALMLSPRLSAGSRGGGMLCASSLVRVAMTIIQ